MTDFEYSNLSSDDEEEVLCVFPKKKRYRQITAGKVSKELRLHYSNLFIDSFNLIDLFIKSKVLTYNSFLNIFSSTHFHQIYAKPKKKETQVYVSPHHYITIAEDSLAVASKFLRSNSREARIGAVYLVYTLYKTQPLKSYLINVKLTPEDYLNTKHLVDTYLNEGLPHPAYCFYDLDIKKKIKITVNAINPCLEANYPRIEIRKHLGRTADKYFTNEYKERTSYTFFNKSLMMEHQMRNESTYLNKLSNLCLGENSVPEYEANLTKTLEEINNAKKNLNAKTHQIKDDEKQNLKQLRYKNKKTIAFPGKNEGILEDMVVMSKTTNSNESASLYCHPRKKLKLLKKRRKISSKNEVTCVKEEPETLQFLPKLSAAIDSDSSISSMDSDDYENNEDKYGDIIWRMLEGQDNSVQ
ncbi:uncharacterized protein LOC112680563 isoform X2 [Sipha flava]|uniref:Uncharacterized protein LOC112680563 isoform X2 n=1 Tax=Sipha flava TaxID=143950 RepID=A0A8B8F775_9HEMI|nr:uncharacterized protein LOC112680563 isoform X2 [Sipha flava]